MSRELPPLPHFESLSSPGDAIHWTLRLATALIDPDEHERARDAWGLGTQGLYAQLLRARAARSRLSRVGKEEAHRCPST